MGNFTDRKIKTRIYTIITVMILLVTGICCGCNFAASKDTNVITPYDETGMNTGSDYNETANALYKICHEQPETLAATMSAFPRQLQQIGITVDDAATAPMVIEGLIEGEDGGAVQLALLDLLKSLLEDPNTKFAFDEWNGLSQMLYMGEHDPNGPRDSANIYLYWEDTVLRDSKIFGMVVGESPETREFAYFYLEGGFQRFVPKLETK